jgi:hypothetical protein
MALYHGPLAPGLPVTYAMLPPSFLIYQSSYPVPLMSGSSGATSLKPRYLCFIFKSSEIVVAAHALHPDVSVAVGCFEYVGDVDA